MRPNDSSAWNEWFGYFKSEIKFYQWKMMAIKPEFPWRRTRKWWRKFVWERRQNSISRLSSILYINKMKIMWKWSNKWNLVSDRVNVDRNQMLPTVEFKRYFAMEDTRKTSKKVSAMKTFTNKEQHKVRTNERDGQNRMTLWLAKLNNGEKPEISFLVSFINKTPSLSVNDWVRFVWGQVKFVCVSIH